MKWTPVQAVVGAILDVACRKNLYFEVLGGKARFWHPDGGPIGKIADFENGSLDDLTILLAALMEAEPNG